MLVQKLIDVEAIQRSATVGSPDRAEGRRPAQRAEQGRTDEAAKAFDNGTCKRNPLQTLSQLSGRSAPNAARAEHSAVAPKEMLSRRPATAYPMRATFGMSNLMHTGGDEKTILLTPLAPN